MNALAPRPAAPRRLPQAAEAVLARFVAGDPTEPLPEHVRAAAARALPDAQARAAPASADDWRGFLRPLAAAVRNPPGDKGLDAFAGLCAQALDTIPEALLTPDRQREAVRRFAFWPAVADLAEWLEPDSQPVRAELAALRRMAAAPALAAPAPTREGPADPAWVAQAAAAAIADLRAVASERRAAQPVKARLLTPQERVIAYALAGQRDTAASVARFHGIDLDERGLPA